MLRCRSGLPGELKRRVQRIIVLNIAVALRGLCSPILTQAKPAIHWQDRFSATEQQKFTAWISGVAEQRFTDMLLFKDVYVTDDI